MKKIFIWGTGHIADLEFEGAKENELNIYNNEVFRIEGVIDNNRKKWGSEFHGFRVVSPGELVERDYDYIIALMDEDWDVRIQAIFGYRVLEKRFKNKS